MKNFFTSIPNLLLSVVLCFVLSSCSSTGVKMNESSPWKTIQFEDQANALDVDFIDDKNGFLVGSNRLIMESNDGGETWEKRKLDLMKILMTLKIGRSLLYQFLMDTIILTWDGILMVIYGLAEVMEL